MRFPSMWENALEAEEVKKAESVNISQKDGSITLNVNEHGDRVTFFPTASGYGKNLYCGISDKNVAAHRHTDWTGAHEEAKQMRVFFTSHHGKNRCLVRNCVLNCECGLRLVLENGVLEKDLLLKFAEFNQPAKEE